MTFKNIKTFVVAAFAAATLFSCSSDESFNNSKLYVNSTLHPNNILPKETIYVIGEDVNNNRFEIPLKITSPISKDLKGTFSIDKDAIELFNAKHKTEYAVPNSEAIHWIQQSVTISSGKYTSDQSAVLEITNFDLLDKSLTYCLPIRITDTDKSLSISNNLNTMFFVFNVVQQDIYPVSVPYEGTEIDPENWIFEDLDNPGSNDLTNLVNGSFFGWSKSAYNCNFTIDLTQEYSLKSIRVEMHSMERVPNQYTISSSLNGTDWIDHGSVHFKVTNTDDLYITLHEEITARYIKVNMGTTAGIMLVKRLSLLY